MIWYKQGVVGDLQPIARKALGKIGAYYESVWHEDLYVTSLRDGNHSPESLHYDGLAFDIRKPSTFQGDTGGLLWKTLGTGWDICVEKDHIHCEFDPKGGIVT